jgi:flagellar FliG-like protein
LSCVLKREKLATRMHEEPAFGTYPKVYSCCLSERKKTLATGIQTGMKRGSRSTISRNDEQGRICRLKELIAPYRNLIFFLTTILILTWFHLGASPVERLLGLSHGEHISTPSADFLVVDHLTPQGAETLNRNLFHYTGGRHEIAVVSGYGLWRLGILMGLLYAMVLLAVRELTKFKVRQVLKSGFSVEYRYLTLLGGVAGVGLGLLGMGNVAPTLFALVFLTVLIVSCKAKPNHQSLRSWLEILDMCRALWFGWLIPSMLTISSTWTDRATLYFVGLLLGCSASFLFRSLGRSASSQGTSQESFGVGCWETLGVLAIGTMSSRIGASHFAGTVILFGAFGFGRFAQSVLLRCIATMTLRPENRIPSAFRVASGVWFLSPLVLSPFFEGFDQTSLMIWLAVLAPLTKYGRPWGSVASYETSAPDQILPTTSFSPNNPLIKTLTPSQKAAVLFMSLPPEMSAQLFSELQPEEVQAITLEITQLPSISPHLRKAVIEEFLGARGVNPIAVQPIADVLESEVSKSPRQTAEQLRSQYMKRRGRRKKRHICSECEDIFNHGIGLRKHQRKTGHTGSKVSEV